MQSIANIGRFSDGDGKTVNNNAEESTKLFNISFCSLFGKKTPNGKVFDEVHSFLLLINIFSGINISKSAGLQSLYSRVITQLTGY